MPYFNGAVPTEGLAQVGTSGYQGRATLGIALD